MERVKKYDEFEIYKLINNIKEESPYSKELEKRLTKPIDLRMEYIKSRFGKKEKKNFNCDDKNDGVSNLLDAVYLNPDVRLKNFETYKQETFFVNIMEFCTYIYNIKNKNIEMVQNKIENITTLKVSNENNFVARGSKSGSIFINDAENLRQIREIKNKKSGSVIAIDICDEILSVSHSKGEIRNHDVREKNSLIDILKHDNGKVYNMGWNKSKDTLITGGTYGFINLWSKHKNMSVFDINAHKEGVTSLSISKYENNVFFTTGKDNKIKKWKNDYLELSKDYVTSGEIYSSCILEDNILFPVIGSTHGFWNMDFELNLNNMFSYGVNVFGVDVFEKEDYIVHGIEENTLVIRKSEKKKERRIEPKFIQNSILR